jgi:outer membrane autotransporter protein
MVTSKLREKQKRVDELSPAMAMSVRKSFDDGLTHNSNFDVWVQGKWSKSTSDTTKSDLGMLYVGADYRFSDSMVIGFLAQVDWTDAEDDDQLIATKGTGWMAGPYLAARLHDNLLFDGRAAWGTADNEVSPLLGLYSDQFDSERWLVKGQFTGDFSAGRWRFNPHVAVIHFEEEQQAYTDSLGNRISSQTVSLGRLTFGPKVSTSFDLPDGTGLTTHLGLKGIWDFDQAEIVDLDTGLASSGSSDDLRGRVDGGLSARYTNGWIVTGNAFYDGIGVDDLESYGGEVGIKIPLH